MSTLGVLTWRAFAVLICLLTSTAWVMPTPKFTETDKTQKETAHELKSQETFTKLRDMFPDPLLDEHFKTLKHVTGSKVYLDFLKQEYPTDEPFKTLAEFIKVASPDVERYQAFLKQEFGKLTDTDFIGVHQLTLTFRRANIKFMHAELSTKPALSKSAVKEKLHTIRKNPIKAWLASRMSDKALEERIKFFLRVEKLVSATEKADTNWIQAQFEEHGQSDGMLWIAIRRPILMGEILTNCSSPDVLLTWVEQTFIQKKIAELEKL